MGRGDARHRARRDGPNGRGQGRDRGCGGRGAGRPRASWTCWSRRRRSARDRAPARRPARRRHRPGSARERRRHAQAGDLALLARFDQAAIRETTAVDAELARQDAASIEPSAFLASLPSRLAAKGIRPQRGRVVGGLRLTPREVEILALVGAGHTDPEIAEALFISPKTASVHVANIKAKLELDTRAPWRPGPRVGLEPAAD